MKKLFRAFRNPWIILTFVILGALGTRVVVEGVQSWERGVIALQDGDDEEAIFQFRNAGRWTLPGFSVPEEAIGQLIVLGNQALETCKQCPTTCNVETNSTCSAASCKSCSKAVYAFDSARAAILGSRSFYTPHGDLLTEVNESLSQSLVRAAEVYEPGPRQSRSTRASRLENHRSQMLVDHAPSVIPAVVVCLGFLAWMIGFFLFLRDGGKDTQGSRMAAPSFKFAMISVCGFVAWISALFFL